VYVPKAGHGYDYKLKQPLLAMVCKRDFLDKLSNDYFNAKVV
jgi:hypothetical protein